MERDHTTLMANHACAQIVTSVRSHSWILVLLIWSYTHSLIILIFIKKGKGKGVLLPLLQGEKLDMIHFENKAQKASKK